jgi:arginine/ornithine N-succinyltransferase beta subunit
MSNFSAISIETNTALENPFFRYVIVALISVSKTVSVELEDCNNLDVLLI